MIPSPPLLLITDRLQARRPLPDLLDAAFAAGCRWASLREKDMDPAGRAALLRELMPVARRHGAVLTVHDDADAARECDGLHLPGGGDVAAARRALGPGKLVGLSCHGVGEVTALGLLRASGDTAHVPDYVTLSPIFASDSKPGYGPMLGFGALSEAARSGIPVLALAGVEADNLAACLRSGAAGAAIMGGIMRADDPGAAMRGLLSSMRAPMRNA
ncbi:MAG TPA: thiamine phosphate synthase [Azospirillaceae bacterium]|nr:thiamine phosphate synthase [Azospirillaceae bacterium]